MNAKELRALRAKLVEDAKALIPADGKISSETRTKFEAMMADAKAQADMIAFMEAEERSALEARSQNMQLPNVGENADADARTPEQRKKDLNASLRSYFETGKIETRDLTVSGNGVMIPTGVAEPVVAKKFAGSIYDLVNKFSTATGEPVKFPLVNDTANGFVLNSTGIATNDPSVATLTISIDDLRMNPILIERSLMQDASFDLASFVSDACQSRYQRYVSQYMTQGNTSNIGALTGNTNTVQSNTTLVLKYVDFVNVLVALDPAYAANACWTMNNATLGAALNVLDGNGRPIFVPYNDGAASGFAGQILGYPVKINPYLPNIGVAAQQVQFGDFKAGYTLREVQPGIVLRRLEERYAELNKVGFVAFARVGGAITDAGTHPIVSMLGK